MDEPVDATKQRYSYLPPRIEGYNVGQCHPNGGEPYYFYEREPSPPRTRVIESSPPRSRKRVKDSPPIVEEEEKPKEKPDETYGKPMDPKRPICFQNKSLILTYKGHLEKEIYEQWFRTRIVTTLAAPGTKVLFIRCAHETGDEKFPYLHTHVLFMLTQPIISRKARVLDYEGVHPNWNYVTTKRHYDNCKRYLAKEDTDNADLLAEDDTQAWKEQVLRADSLKDAVMNTRCKPTDIGGLKMFRDLCRTPEHEPNIKIEHFLRWQRGALEIMNKGSAPRPDVPVLVDENPDDDSQPINGLGDLYFSLGERFVHVVHDPKGASGKTAFIKALVFSNPKRFFMMQTIPNARDFATIIEGALQGGWTGDTLLFNMPRQQEDHKVHTTIECAVDAFVTSTKYQGKTSTWAGRNIWIFTNTIPNPHRMTPDRWRYYSISADFQKNMMSNLRHMSYEEGLALYQAQIESREERDVSPPRRKTQY